MRNVTRYIVLGSLFIIPFLSLVVMGPPFFPNWFFPFITGKNFLFRILVEVASVSYLLLALIDKRYRPQWSWTLVFLGAFTVWMFIADMLAVNPHKAFWSNYERMDGWVTLIHLFLLFVVAGSVLTVEKKWNAWWKAFLGGALMVSLYALTQLFHLNAIHQGSTRLDASLGNAEYLAGYMLFAIGIALWQYMQAEGVNKKMWRVGLGIFAALEFVILIFTQTRGTLIGLVGGVFVGAIYLAVIAKGRVRAFAAGAVIALLLLVGAFYSVRESSFVQNNGTLHRFASVFSGSEFTTRFTIAHMALKGAAEKPVTGWGQEGFNYVFNKYYEPSLYAQEQWFDRAHDIFFDWLIAGGYPALILFVLLLASVFWSVFRAPFSRAEKVVLVSLLTAYMIQGLTVFDNLFTYIPLIMLFAVAHSYRSSRIELLENLPEVPAQTGLYVGAPLGFVAGVLIIWFVNVPSMIAAGDLITALSPAQDPQTNLTYFKKTVADHSFASQEIAEQLSTYAQSIVQSGSVPNDLKSEFLTLAFTQMAAEITHAPNDARLHLEYASLYSIVGDSSDAAAQLELAHTLSPNKQTILLQQGVQAFQAGDNKTAHVKFDAAYALDTSSHDVAAYAAAGRIITGDTKGAKALLQSNFGTTTVGQNILAAAYYGIQDYQDLILVLQAEIRQDPTAAIPQYQLAEVYAAVGRTAEAKALVTATLAAHPETADQAKALSQQLGVTQ